MINTRPDRSAAAETGIDQLIRAAAQRLAAAGVESPRVDAELLLAELLDVPRSRLLTRDAIPASAAATYDQWLTRRVAREPLQHITGRAPFRHLMLEVGPGVFVPRPETELLVDAVLPHLPANPLVVDLCAGSGALALAVAGEVPGARVVAVERLRRCSSAALARNADGPDVRLVLGATWPTRSCSAPSTVGSTRCSATRPPYVPRTADVSPEAGPTRTRRVFAGADGLEVGPRRRHPGCAAAAPGRPARPRARRHPLPAGAATARRRRELARDPGAP